MMKVRVLAALAIIIAVVAGLVAWWQTLSRAQAVQEAPLLSRSEAISRAIGEARFLGLQGDPTEVRAQVMTLGNYADLMGNTVGSDAAKVGLDPNMPVWVVALKGRVVWKGPGRPGGQPPEVFDNITIELDAKTGEIKGTARYRRGTPLLFRD